MCVDSRSGKVLSRTFYSASTCNFKNEEFHLRLDTLEGQESKLKKKKKKSDFKEEA